jgi:hypothetical protein
LFLGSKHKVSQGYSPADLPILAKCEALKTGTMVCFVNVDRIIYSIFQRFNLEWKNRTLKLLHKQLDITRPCLP